jgi:hypothetical protein
MMDDPTITIYPALKGTARDGSVVEIQPGTYLFDPDKAGPGQIRGWVFDASQQVKKWRWVFIKLDGLKPVDNIGG